MLALSVDSIRIGSKKLLDNSIIMLVHSKMQGKVSFEVNTQLAVAQRQKSIYHNQMTFICSKMKACSCVWTIIKPLVLNDSCICQALLDVRGVELIGGHMFHEGLEAFCCEWVQRWDIVKLFCLLAFSAEVSLPDLSAKATMYHLTKVMT